MGKPSKRKVKNRDARTCKQLAGGSQQGSGLDLLSEELKEQLLASGGASDALIVVPTAKQEKDATQEQDAEEPQLSKSQLRKLKQVQLKKERRENLTQVLANLASSSLSEDALSLMRPLHQRGARETKKQRLRRALKLERAGVALDAATAEELHPSGNPRGKGKHGSVEDSDNEGGSASGSESEDDEEMVGPGSNSAGPNSGPLDVAKQADGAAPGVPSHSDSGSESDEGGSAEGGDAEEDAEAAKQRAALKAAKVREEIRKARKEAGIAEDGSVDDGNAGLVQPSVPPTPKPAGAHRVVHITRPPQIEEARLGLPIIGMEQEIMEAISQHDVLVLCGETGCGKTTQVPQFLLEAGYGCGEFPERAGRVGVTQPRRVAATSTAARVAAELGEGLGGAVGYQVRYDRVVGGATRLKFMTDGVLLRELQDDFLLSKYSALLVDEAHERSLNTDLLLGMLSRVVPLRRKLWAQQRAQRGYDPAAPDAVHPLKLIIMSATLRTSDFVENARLFPKPPPVIEVPARQFPVTVHFSRRTELHDYVGAAHKKVLRIHRELPPGGVLVFLTGQREVEVLVAKLKASNRTRAPAPGSGRDRDGDSKEGGQAAGERSQQESELAGGSGGRQGLKLGLGLLGEGAAAEAGDDPGDGADAFGEDGVETWARRGEEEDVGGGQEGEDDYDEMNDSGDEDEEEVEVLGGENRTPEEIEAAEKAFEEALAAASGHANPTGGLSGGAGSDDGPGKLHVLPLYALLPAEEQARVFQPPPPGHRLVIVATNVAETSLTIPGVRYVVDAGRSKQRLLDHSGGSAARFEVRWVSQAAAAQRAGRAGRTGPGHCYRLFSSAHYAHTMPKFGAPEIVNTSLEGVVLVMKAMGVDKVPNFPFPTPPEQAALQSAEACLVALGALTSGGALTSVGRAMAAFPIGPRHARMMLEVAAWQLRMGGASDAATSSPPSAALATEALPLAVALAAVLTVDAPFVHIDSIGGPKQDVKKAEAEGEGDEEGAGGKKTKADAAEALAAKAEREEAGRKQQRARAAHAALRVNDSDALSALRALCAFMAAGEDDSFCKDNYLHARNLREAADLTRQLARCLATAPTSRAAALPSASTTSSGKPAVNLAAELAAVAGAAKGQALHKALAARQGGRLPTALCDLLRRAMAVGWADQVARRVRSAEHVKRQLATPTGKRHAVRYASCALANVSSMGVDAAAAAAAAAKAEAAGVEEEVSGDVFLHPRSALHSTSPDYVVYGSLVRTEKRPYMAGVTAVEPEWLSHCGTPLAVFSPPLPEPVPAYAPPPTDAVMAWHDVAYGRHGWPLPRCLRPHPDAATRSAVFAAALLDGRVVPGFAQLRPQLLTAPALASKPEMRGVARVGELVGALAARKVSSLSSLCAQWQVAPSFLREQVGAWVPKAGHSKLAALWPQLVKEGMEAEEKRRQDQLLAQQKAMKKAAADGPDDEPEQGVKGSQKAQKSNAGSGPGAGKKAGSSERLGTKGTSLGIGAPGHKPAKPQPPAGGGNGQQVTGQVKRARVEAGKQAVQAGGKAGKGKVARTK